MLSKIRNLLLRIWPFLFGIFSFIYYSLLATKQWSWVMTGQDTGDWMAATNWWFTPQPYGSPLYVSLARIIGLLPGNTVAWMTILLSCLPAAITVTIIILLVRNRTNSNFIASICGAIVLGATVMLTQATIVEEYSIAVMFVTLALWAYYKEKKALVAVFLGLGIAVHIIVLAITIVFVMLEYKNRKQWIRYLPLVIIFGVLPYTLTLWTMWNPDTLKFIGGNLSLSSLMNYIGSSGTLMTLSIYEAPKRLLQATSILLPMFGLAWIAIVKGCQEWKTARFTALCLVTLIFVVWLYVTDQDYTTWTFLCYGVPFAAILAGDGLVYLTSHQRKAILASACLLVLLNSVFLNANMLAKHSPQATEYKSQLESLPDGTFVCVSQGGARGLGLLYVLSEDKDLAIIVLKPKLHPESPIYNAYLQQSNSKYDMQGINTLERIQYELDKDRLVIFADPINPQWEAALVLVPYSSMLQKVTGIKTGVDLSQIWSDWTGENED